MDKFGFLPFIIYCERQGNTGWTSEPFNTVSNIAFFVAAYFMYRLLKRHESNKNYLVFPLLTVLIGIGSTLYHSFRSVFTLALDATPIYLFVLVFLFYVLPKLLPAKKAFVYLLGFVALQVIVSLLAPREFLNGSVRHLVNFLLFPALLVAMAKKFPQAKQKLQAMWLMYGAAIFLRSIEPTVCPYLPIGTHFTWHLLTALVTYVSVETLMLTNKKNG